MVETLNKNKISAAKTLLVSLDRAGWDIDAFLWIYLTPDTWRLVIVSSDFDKKTPRQVYKEFIKKFYKKIEVKEIGIENISLAPSKSTLLKLLRKAFRTPSKANTAVRFTSNTIDGVYIEDAYIYRLR